MNKELTVYVFLLCASFLKAQLKPTLIWPLDSPRVLTGNFGELRPNHFHTGLDFSTNGLENLQVYAIEEGFVSRIRVSPVGYGKALYITHANGKVSVYAHLNAFSLKIDKVLKEEQYAKQNSEVDFYPKPWSLYLRKNEIVGLSGNTGGSSGPHLHFELRDEKTEVTINPLTIYHVDDRIVPVLQQVAFYALNDSIAPVFLRSVYAETSSLKDTFELAGSTFGLAFEGYDQYLKNGNHNNVYAAKVFLDSTLIYHHELKKMDFADFRYVNEFCENNNRHKFQKCFLPDLYPQYLYPYVKNRGKISMNDERAHRIRLELFDESGNIKELDLYVRAKQVKEVKTQSRPFDALVSCFRDTTVFFDYLSIHFPSQSLFNHLPLYFKLGNEGLDFNIQPWNTNLRSAIVISLKLPQSLVSTKERVVLLTEHSVVIPEIRNDSLLFSVKNLGNFRILLDNKAPEVKTNLASKKRQPKRMGSRLEFYLSDNLSGIGKYALFLNDQWVIAEYDAKSHRLFYQFEEDSPTGLVYIKLQVYDRVGNISEFKYSVKR